MREINENNEINMLSEGQTVYEGPFDVHGTDKIAFIAQG